jgi:predicted MPP superfamily phosphohydrolase
MESTTPGAAEASPFRRVPVWVAVRALAGFLLMLAVAAGLHGYIGHRLIVGLSLSDSAATVAWVALGLLFLSMPLAMVLTRAPRSAFSRAAQWVAFTWMGAFALLFPAVLVTELVRVFVDAQAQSWAIVGAVTPAFVYGLYVANRAPRVEQVRHPEAVAPGLKGLRIVQISDLHIGPTLGREFLEGIVAQVNALEPDLVAVTGDLVDGRVRDLRDEVAPLGGLRARLGAYFVTGNHELYSGAAEWEAEVRRLGLTVLHNEHRVLTHQGERLVVAGITDHDTQSFDPDSASSPKKALAGAPEGVFRLLLAHQPRSAFQAEGLQVSLQLSGHTHGGQIFPWTLLVRLQQPVNTGLRRIAGTWVYTSRGTGYWGPPIRVGPSSEVTVVTLG